MIHIERGLDPLPMEEQRLVAAARERLHEKKNSLGRQQRIQFDSSVWKIYRMALQEIFHSKCAYCESQLMASSSGVVDHFYPKSLYPEFAYNWSNLHLVCEVCNINKGASDPVDRATGLVWLLDPCIDDPEKFLVFLADGIVAPRAGASSDIQQRVVRTIATLGLNRENLVHARRHHIAQTEKLVQSLLDRMKSATQPDLASAIAMFTPSSGVAYSAAVRDALRRAMGKIELPELRPTRRAPASTTAAIRSTFIQRIEIEGFRLAESIDLIVPLREPSSLQDSSPSGEGNGSMGWLALLGENATAKTTVLHAVALALMGRHHARRWPHDPLTRSPGGSRTQGFIRVHLSTDPEPIEVIFDANGPRFTSGQRGARTLVRGYGAVRLTAASRLRRQRPAQWVDNLFDPRAQLGDPNEWAASLDRRSLDAFGYATKDLLELPDDYIVEVTNGRLEIRTPNGTFSYSELSSGYQHMLSLLADLTAATQLTGAADPSYCPGIVLIDELGTHLHPRLRMAVVGGLRRAFRCMQFLVTTHEPLCLRGLKQGEIVLLERNDRGGVRAEANLPDPTALRVDQLLTSRFFGLHSTIDPILDVKFQQYYELLSSHRRSDAQEQELDALRRELRQHTVLGYTRRDQIVYDIIDEYLAREPKLDPATRRALENDTRRRVSDLWASASFAARRTE